MTIADLFCGAGNGEIDADYFAAAMARIKRETAQTTLFT